MARRSIATVLGPLLIGLLIAVNVPAVGADAPCITDGQENCFEAQALAGPSMSMEEYDTILTALEMVGTATIIPVAANLTGPASEPDQQMTTWSVNF